MCCHNIIPPELTDLLLKNVIALVSCDGSDTSIDDGNLEESTDESADESTDGSADGSADESTDGSADESADKDTIDINNGYTKTSY